MQRLWQVTIKFWLLIGVGSLICGCATRESSLRLSPPLELHDRAPTLPKLARLHQQGRVKFLAGPGGTMIPMRVFGAEGKLNPVLMTHGLESHSAWFVQSAAFMAGLGHPVYLVDRRGSGLSREERGHCADFREWSRELAAVAHYVIEEHRTNKLHVVGHCFGALPAAVFAIENPHQVASLILPTPGFVTATDLKLTQKLQVLSDHLTGGHTYLPVSLTPEQFTNAEEYREFIRQDELKLHEATTAFYWNVNCARKFVHARRADLRFPVWMGLAGQDEIVRADKTRELFRSFGSDQKRLVVFPDAKHILEFSPARDAFFHELEKWLACGGS